jgi:hypothetical protein
MKKLIVALATVFVVAVVFTGVAASGGGGKVVAEGFTCGILDGNGNIFTTNNSVLIEYQTRAVLQCSGDGAPYTGPNPPHYFTYAETGLSCGMLQFGSTTDWVDKVGRGGNSQLTCQTAKAASASGAGGGLG